VIDTPRTDALYFRRGMLTMYDLAGEMKKLERELAEAKATIQKLHVGIEEQNQRIKALVEAGDAMAKDFSHFWTDRNSVRDWPKVKEGAK